MVSREEDHHQWPIKLGSHCHLSPRKFHCASSESSRSFKQVLIVCVCSTAIDSNTPESNLGDTVWRWWCPSAPSGLAGLALYIEIIMIVSLISGLQVHDTCNSEELTQKHLYNIISTTREAASVLNLKRPAGPPLLGKFPYKFSTNSFFIKDAKPRFKIDFHHSSVLETLTRLKDRNKVL